MSDLKEIKDRYHLAWQDWYYWPMSDQQGEREAKKRLEAIGKELNEATKKAIP